MAGGWRGKVVRHRCGYPLWTRVIASLEWASQVVVEYRDGRELGLVVYVCPGCGKELRLWWPMPGEVSQGESDVSVFAGRREQESEVGLC